MLIFLFAFFNRYIVFFLVFIAFYSFYPKCARNERQAHKGLDAKMTKNRNGGGVRKGGKRLSLSADESGLRRFTYER